MIIHLHRPLDILTPPQKQFEGSENNLTNLEKNVLVAYRGPFNNLILHSIGNYLKDVIKDRPKISYKIFSIYVELAQNIYFYSSVLPHYQEKVKNGYGAILIEEKNNIYTIYASNVLNNKQAKKIVNKTKHINELEREDLRKLKKANRRLNRSEKGGANIGLIQVALMAASPLITEVTPLENDYAFLTITTKIIG